jgi:hypothetical protein
MKIKIRILYQPPTSPFTLSKKIEIEIPNDSKIRKIETDGFLQEIPK